MDGSPTLSCHTLMLGALVALAVAASMLVLPPTATAQGIDCEYVPYNERVILRCVTTDGDDDADGNTTRPTPDPTATPGPTPTPGPSATPGPSDEADDEEDQEGEDVLADRGGRGSRLEAEEPEPEPDRDDGAADGPAPASTTPDTAMPDTATPDVQNQSEGNAPAVVPAPTRVDEDDRAPGVRVVRTREDVPGSNLPIIVGVILLLTLGAGFLLSARRARNEPLISGSDQRTRE